MAIQKSFRAGQVLFEAGDDSTEVLRVLEGSVDIVRKLGRNQVLIGTVEPPGLVGEIGVLLGRPHSTTAEAGSAVTVEVLSREAFLGELGSDPVAAEALIQRASARLRGADDQLVEALKGEIEAAAKPGVETAARSDAQSRDTAGADGLLLKPPPLPAIEIKAVSESLRALVGSDPIPVTRLPFLVGRTASTDERDPIIQPDLPLKESPPHLLSRRHFLLFAEDGKLFVRDLDSTLGTQVNGEPIGRDHEASVAELKPGDNRVAPGDGDSSYAFIISVR
jgi:hypothetical protein